MRLVETRVPFTSLPGSTLVCEELRVSRPSPRRFASRSLRALPFAGTPSTFSFRHRARGPPLLCHRTSRYRLPVPVRSASRGYRGSALGDGADGRPGRVFLSPRLPRELNASETFMRLWGTTESRSSALATAGFLRPYGGNTRSARLVSSFSRC